MGLGVADGEGVEHHGMLVGVPPVRPIQTIMVCRGRPVSSALQFRVVDRIAKVVTKRRLDDPDTSWIDYWRTRPMEERLAMATELSQECVDGDAQQRLRRVHRVLRRS